MRTVEHHIDADRRAFDIDADCRASSIRKRECFGFVLHIFAGRVVTTDNTGALWPVYGVRIHRSHPQLRVVAGVDGSGEGSEEHDRRSHRVEKWLVSEECACEGQGLGLGLRCRHTLGWGKRLKHAALG
eukprot:scaffold6502_cov66-Phaeocystis_antarctica.AAC.5